MFLSIRAILVIILFCPWGLGGLLRAEQGMEELAIAALVEKLGDEEFAVREQAERALREQGEEVADALRAFRSHPDPEVRRRVRNVLAHVATLRNELDRIDPKFEGRANFRSGMAADPVKLTFRNLSGRPILIFWSEWDGDRRPWREVLKPGETAVCGRSYMGHVWVVTDEGGEALGLYKIDRKDPVIAVRD